MKEKGWDNDRIRVGFGDILKRQRYSMLDDEMKEKMKEELEFVPIPISVIKGLGIGKCVELSLLSQNILSFLGYNTFMLQGTTILDDSKPTAHQYNFIEKDGKYCIFDAALESVGIISKIKTPEDFLDFGEITLKGIHGQEITYLSERKKMKCDKPMEKMSVLAKKGENYRNEAANNIKLVLMSKRLMGETDKYGER